MLNWSRFTLLQWHRNPFPSSGSGIYFEESNDVVSAGKNVSCMNCSSSHDQHGVVIRDSIDIFLDGTISREPLSGPSLDIDNSGITEREGSVSLSNITVFQNSSTHSVELNLADATIDNLEIVGSNYGIKWTAIGGMTSYLNSSLIRGSQGCMELIDHTDLVSSSVHFECEERIPLPPPPSLISLTPLSLHYRECLTHSQLLGTPISGGYHHPRLQHPISQAPTILSI